MKMSINLKPLPSSIHPPTVPQMTKKRNLQNVKSKEISGGHRSKVHSVNWNYNGTKLASGSTDHTIRIWPVDRLTSGTTKEGSWELRGHTSGIDQLAWSPTTDLLVSVSSDKTVRLWDSTSHRHTLTTLSENITVSWSPDGERIAVGSKVEPGGRVIVMFEIG